MTVVAPLTIVNSNACSDDQLISCIYYSGVREHDTDAYAPLLYDAVQCLKVVSTSAASLAVVVRAYSTILYRPALASACSLSQYWTCYISSESC
jgi:hypothetical protein